MTHAIARFLAALGELLAESSWLLLVGFALAGIIHVLLEKRRNLLDPLTRPGPGAVVLATLIGAPLPLCSCSVLPAGLSLLRKGARRGPTSAFLISVPETDVVSIGLTWSLMGPVMAVLRPVSAVVTGILTGLAVDAVGGPPPATAAPAPAPSCGCPDETGPGTRRPAWREALRFGFVEFFDEIAGRLVLGLLGGAAIAVLLPSLDFESLAGRHVLSYAAMLLVGLPMYVCAAASTPVAAGLIVGGMNPGAVLVFLLVGPATNLAGLLVLDKEFGRRALVAHVTGIVVVALAAGLLVDHFAGGLSFTRVGAALHEHGAITPLQWAGTGLFVLLTLASLLRTRRR
jgi:hypothetical protein